MREWPKRNVEIRGVRGARLLTMTCLSCWGSCRILSIHRTTPTTTSTPTTLPRPLPLPAVAVAVAVAIAVAVVVVVVPLPLRPPPPLLLLLLLLLRPEALPNHEHVWRCQEP